MSRSLLRCRNPACSVPHGAVLGRLTEEGGLVLAAEVERFAVFLNSRRCVIYCPLCGTARDFGGAFVRSR